jgi:hypothetical protein
MLALGALGVAGSQWYYTHVQHKAVGLWGSPAADAIAKAPLAIALRFGPPGTASVEGTIETHTFGTTRLGVIDRRAVMNAPGFSHLRASLLLNETFVWDSPADDCQSQWDYGLQFEVGDMPYTLLFAPNCHRVMLAPTGATAVLHSSDEFVKFFHEVFGE